MADTATDPNAPHETLDGDSAGKQDFSLRARAAVAAGLIMGTVVATTPIVIDRDHASTRFATGTTAYEMIAHTLWTAAKATGWFVFGAGTTVLGIRLTVGHPL